MHARAIASDSRGEAANLFSFPIGEAKPLRLEIALPPNGRVLSFPLEGAEIDRYHRLTAK